MQIATAAEAKATGVNATPCNKHMLTRLVTQRNHAIGSAKTRLMNPQDSAKTDLK